jgi:hypothetical protein
MTSYKEEATQEALFEAFGTFNYYKILKIPDEANSSTIMTAWINAKQRSKGVEDALLTPIKYTLNHKERREEYDGYMRRRRQKFEDREALWTKKRVAKEESKRQLERAVEAVKQPKKAEEEAVKQPKSKESKKEEEIVRQSAESKKETVGQPESGRSSSMNTDNKPQSQQKEESRSLETMMKESAKDQEIHDLVGFF